MKKLNKKQAARENGAKGGRKARAEPTAEPGGGVQADEPAATATPAPATVTQEAAAADTLEAADDMAVDRGCAALAEQARAGFEREREGQGKGSGVGKKDGEGEGGKKRENGRQRNRARHMMPNGIV